MNDFRLSPEDPKLTAYALGQLEGDERAAVEAALRDDPEARRFVEQTKAFAAQLETALLAEPEPQVAASAEGRVTIVPPAQPASPAMNGKHLPEYDPSSKVLRFPQLYFVIGGLAAASVAVLVALHDEKPPVVRQYTEIRLNPPTAKVAKADEMPSAPAVVAEAEGKVAASPIAAAMAAAATADRLKMREEAAARAKVDLSRFAYSASQTGEVATTNPESVTLSVQPPRNDKVVVGNTGHTFGAGGVAVFGGTLSSNGSIYVTSGGQHAPLTLGAPASGGISQAPLPRNQPSTEAYAYQPDNAFVGPQQAPFSTFSIDVDTASYSNVRRFVTDGRLPPADAVRIEELLNYFPYRYAAPKPADATPFAASLEVASAPWAPTHRLVRIGLKARELATAERPAANLVFLLDVSGSMSAPNKLPLVKESMRLLVQALRPDDRVAIVTYAGQSGLALASTPVAKASEIEAALEDLRAGGSTNGAMGIQLAYDIAKANFVSGGINRVVLCTDGDFNVGTTSQGELVRLVEEKARSGVALTALGFGMGNLKDSTLESLADKGNGNYGYIDSRLEAQKVLVQQVNGTLMTVAKDVKIQVDFNPATVASYRLIGYENRLLQAQDFNNDKVDAGEIGAGHTVTALYEIVPTGVEDAVSATLPPVDASKYRPAAGAQPKVAPSAELLTVKIRYKQPDADVSEKLEFPLTDGGAAFVDASPDFKFAAAVAEFGMILRNSPHRGKATMGDVIAWAAAGAAKPGDDPGGYRGDFLDLARRAQTLVQ